MLMRVKGNGILPTVKTGCGWTTSGEGLRHTDRRASNLGHGSRWGHCDGAREGSMGVDGGSGSAVRRRWSLRRRRRTAGSTVARVVVLLWSGALAEDVGGGGGGCGRSSRLGGAWIWVAEELEAALGYHGQDRRREDLVMEEDGVARCPEVEEAWRSCWWGSDEATARTAFKERVGEFRRRVVWALRRTRDMATRRVALGSEVRGGCGSVRIWAETRLLEMGTWPREGGAAGVVDLGGACGGAGPRVDIKEEVAWRSSGSTRMIEGGAAIRRCGHKEEEMGRPKAVMGRRGPA